MTPQRDKCRHDAHSIELQSYPASSEASRQVFIDEWHRQLLEELSSAGMS